MLVTEAVIMNWFITQQAASVILIYAVMRCKMFGEQRVARKEDKIIWIALFVLYQFGWINAIEGWFNVAFGLLFASVLMLDRRIGYRALYAFLFAFMMFTVFYNFLPNLLVPSVIVMFLGVFAMYFYCPISKTEKR
jgi:hypothetical protein